MHRTGLPWTKAETDSLKQAWSDPFWTRDVIAASLRRSVLSVATQASALGLGGKKRPAPIKRNGQWSKNDIARLRELRDLGTMNLDQIAHQLGRSVAACIACATRHNMPKKTYVTIPRVKKPRPAIVNGLRETPRMQQARALLAGGYPHAIVIATLKLTSIEAAELRKR